MAAALAAVRGEAAKGTAAKVAEEEAKAVGPGEIGGAEAALEEEMVEVAKAAKVAEAAVVTGKAVEVPAASLACRT